MFIKPFQTMVLMGDADKVGETFPPPEQMTTTEWEIAWQSVRYFEANHPGQTARVLVTYEVERTKEGKLTELYVGANGWTVGTCAKYYQLETYDTALPQQWFEACLRHGFEPGGRVVWKYDEHDLFGSPFCLTYEAEQYWRRIERYVWRDLK